MTFLRSDLHSHCKRRYRNKKGVVRAVERKVVSPFAYKHYITYSSIHFVFSLAVYEYNNIPLHSNE